jgi:sialidase-1
MSAVSSPADSPAAASPGRSEAGGRMARVLARRGELGYRQFRIPALLRTQAGTLVAVCDARPLLDDLPSPIDLVVRRSTDEGATWEDWEVLRTGTGLEGFGDASLLQDPATGAILCWHVSTTRWGFFESEAGLERTQHCELSVSLDEGGTWEHRRLTSQLNRPGIRSLFPASGSGLVLRNGPRAGRLLQPFVVMTDPADGSPGVIASAVAMSDDHGATWRLGEVFSPTADGVHSNEHSLAELPDGSVVSCSRATPHRLWAVSADGGESFAAPAPVRELPDPSDNGGVLALPEGLVVVSHNRHPQLRCDTALTVGRAGRGGEVTWGGAVRLCPGASGYSTLVALPDGGVGVFMERGAYEEMVFARVGSDELEAAAGRPAGSQPVAGAAASAIAALGPLASDAWAAERSAEVRPVAGGDAGSVASTDASNGPAAGTLHTRVVPRSITPAPPEKWELRGEHLFLSGEAITAPASEGKEKGATAAQIVASREDLAANLAPASATAGPLDLITVSATARWDGPHAVVLSPRWVADGRPAGEALLARPGATVPWLHLSRALGDGELGLAWDVAPA